MRARTLALLLRTGGAVGLGLGLGGIAGASCGARSELPIWEVDAGEDAKPDVADAKPDVADAKPDVPPTLPPCVEGAKYVYLVTAETDLYKFDPSINSFEKKGSLTCSGDPGITPFSMGVRRDGTAFVVYNDGNLYQVDTETVACEPTGWTPGGDQSFWLFGMGYAIDDDLKGETLHVAEISFQFPSVGLATIDTETFELDFIDGFSENPGNSIELTSSSDGQLYGYFINADETGGTLVRIDKHTAKILEATPLPVGQNSSALAFAQWEGEFYIFTTAPDGVSTHVTRYQPDTGDLSLVFTLDRIVVGAGVSTCTLAE